jgi:hypothetical protein
MTGSRYILLTQSGFSEIVRRALQDVRVETLTQQGTYMCIGFALAALIGMAIQFFDDHRHNRAKNTKEAVV